jgi:hypothetical protein
MAPKDGPHNCHQHSYPLCLNTSHISPKRLINSFTSTKTIVISFTAV